MKTLRTFLLISLTFIAFTAFADKDPKELLKANEAFKYGEYAYK